MTKKILPLFLMLLSLGGLKSDVNAQTTRDVVVEHFTNTRCGICRSRNPGLFSNLKTSPEVHHIAYHPSSPYSSCVLNKHDVSGNDDRTRFYGVYGSTPRVVVQGNAKGVGQDFTAKSLFSSDQGQMTPVDIQLTTLKKGMDSLNVRIAIKTLATHSLSDMNLYVVAVEDTVFYDAPNGEKEHFDVFRKVLLDQPVTIPTMVGDSVVFMVKTENRMDWNASRMFVMAMVQSSNKEIEQVASSKGDEDVDDGGGNVGINTLSNEQFLVYPNPVNNVLNVITEGSETQVRLTSLEGSTLVQSDWNNTHALNLSALAPGVYFVTIQSPEGSTTQKIVKSE